MQMMNETIVVFLYEVWDARRTKAVEMSDKQCRKLMMVPARMKF